MTWPMDSPHKGPDIRNGITSSWHITLVPFQGSFRGQTLERGIATPDSLDQDKVIHKQLVGSVGRLSWDGVNRKYSDFSQDPSAESSTSLISEDEERRVSRRNRLLMVIVLILILVFGACVALYLGLTFGKGQVKDGECNQTVGLSKKYFTWSSYSQLPPTVGQNNILFFRREWWLVWNLDEYIYKTRLTKYEKWIC